MLKKQLPARIYGDEEHVADLQQAFERQIELLCTGRDEVFSQARVSTATGWGLTLWEKAFGLAPAPEREDAWRRARILAKLRGSATTTREVIERMAAGVSTQGALVTEYPRQNRFEISFGGQIGIPENIEALALAIEEVKPAHLAYAFVYLWRRYRELTDYRHGELRGKTHRQIRSDRLMKREGETI